MSDGELAALAVDAVGQYVLDLPDGDLYLPPPSPDQLSQWRRFAGEPDELFGSVKLRALTDDLHDRIRPHLSRPQVGAVIADDLLDHYGMRELDPYTALMIDRFGSALEYDLHDELGMDLLEWFRGRYPWRKLARLMYRLPADGHYHAARSMDEELARATFKARDPKAEKPPLTPLGFSQSVQLQMATVEAIRSLEFTLRRVHGGNAAPPRPLERPVTALARIEREADREYVDSHLKRLGVQGI